MTLKRMTIQFRVISKIDETNKTNLSEQKKFRLSEIIGIENYFHEEINQRKSCNKKLSKYVTTFDYIDKILIVLSTTKQFCSLYHFSWKCCWSTSWNSKFMFYLMFSLTTRIIKKLLLSITRNKKKKHDKILMLAKSKLDSIETLISQAMIDMEISHE